MQKKKLNKREKCSTESSPQEPKQKPKLKSLFQVHTRVAGYTSVCTHTCVRLHFWLPAPQHISLPIGVPCMCTCRRWHWTCSLSQPRRTGWWSARPRARSECLQRAGRGCGDTLLNAAVGREWHISEVKCERGEGGVNPHPHDPLQPKPEQATINHQKPYMHI